VLEEVYGADHPGPVIRSTTSNPSFRYKAQGWLVRLGDEQVHPGMTCEAQGLAASRDEEGAPGRAALSPDEP
jgi:hypothetical protein